MFNLLYVPTAVMVLFGGAFVVNEWGHGGVSEAAGMGHHHLLDYGDAHCAAHSDMADGSFDGDRMHGNASAGMDDCQDGHRMRMEDHHA